MRNFEFVCWDGLCSAGISWTLVVHVGKPWIHWTFNSNSSNFKVMTRPRCCCCRKCKTRIEGKTNCKKKIWTDCKTCFGQIVKLFFLTNYKTFSSPQGVVQWSPTRPFGILEKKMYSTKVPPEFDRAQISTYFYSLSISNESDAILTKPKHAELQLHNFQQSIKGQPKLKVLLSKAMQEKANLKFIQGTGYTLYLSILVHHRTI